VVWCSPKESCRGVVRCLLDGEFEMFGGIMIAICAISCFYVLRSGRDGEAAGLGNEGDIDVEPLAGEMGEGELCGMVSRRWETEVLSSSLVPRLAPNRLK
jgi:hypothetical protein